MHKLQEQPSAVSGSVAEDLSIYLLAGRVPKAGPFGPFARRHGVIAEAEDAERLGFSRVWVAERYSNKEAGVILATAAARTSRLGIATGPIPIGVRSPLLAAAMGGTLQSVFGPRVTLGLGRSLQTWIQGHGFNEMGYDAIVDYASILKRLWASEKVTYDGPAGRLSDFAMDNLPEGPPPRLEFCCFGGPKATKIAANPVFDGVALASQLNVEAVGDFVGRVKGECERIGRDPATLRITAAVTAAPDCEEERMLELVGSRIAVYMQMAGFGELLMRVNKWDSDADRDAMLAIRNHALFRDLDVDGDHVVERDDMIDLSRELIPEKWLKEGGVIGSADECMKGLRQFKEAGADEIAIYGPTPTECADLAGLWRQRLLDASGSD